MQNRDISITPGKVTPNGVVVTTTVEETLSPMQLMQIVQGIDQQIISNNQQIAQMRESNKELEKQKAVYAPLLEQMRTAVEEEATE